MAMEMSVPVLLLLWSMTCMPLLALYLWASIDPSREAQTEAQAKAEEGCSTYCLNEDEPLCIQLTPLRPEEILKVRRLVAMQKRNAVQEVRSCHLAHAQS
mmetsp:Transcript_91613/g.264194  ORF Transcript_91613/g.264194 Transcript_91613/m.264194 type:complete len:100 (-) Transcript_91613:86-385(-)